MRLQKSAAVAAALLAFSMAAQAGEKVWISLGDAALEQLQKHAQVQIAATGAAPMSAQLAGARKESVHLVQVDESVLAQLSEAIHHELKRCGGFMYHPTQEAGRASLARTSGVASLAAPLAVTRPGYTITNQAIVTPMINQMQASNIGQTIVDLSNFTNRYYQTSSGVQASDWLKQKWTTMASGRADISVAQFAHANWAQKSVIATITGTERPNEIVVIGGHLDSINQSNTGESGRAPGADDDASGVASLTEVYRQMIASGYKPKRTLKFMAYAAEEVGLRGSQEIATSFANAGANVVGVMQLDMTNYKGAANDIYIFTDYTDSQQNSFVQRLITTYLPTLKVGSDRCGYACSDHASWNAKGYYASMPFESSMSASNPRIHTANDTYANMGSTADHALKFARMGLAYMVELGSEGVDDSFITVTYNGSLTNKQTKSFGPFPAGVGTFTAGTTGTGDIDLFVKKNTVPTTSSYDCRSVSSSATENCSLNITANGNVYVLLQGYTAGTYNLTVRYKKQ